MNGQPEFNLLESPLEKSNLIEASAGTGKTYAITGIFLRLLLEKKLSVRDILVMTYTVAATEELRDRIRKTIRAAAAAFAGDGADDPFLDGLVEKYPHRERAMHILKTALAHFDEAPISTIHGFCLRVLQENAFESLALFDTALVPDERTLKKEIIEDFWRLHFYDAPPELFAYAVSRKYSPTVFMKLTAGRLYNPDMRIRPDAPLSDPDALEAFRDARQHLRAVWPSCREDVLEMFGDAGLKRNIYKNPENLIARMDGYLQSEAPFPLFDQFEKFTPAGLKAGTKKDATTPEHSFFLHCEAFAAQYRTLECQLEGRLLYLKTEIFRYLRQELIKRKQKRNIQFYDDLLIRLKDALDTDSGEDLRRNLRRRYRAVLVDEFQDTDPIQYAAFHQVFGDGNTPLFLIGDPKQSIYSFRGADLFAYMRAARHVDFRYTLKQNWRSEPALIEAVNALFSNPVHAPFVYDDIPFRGTVAADVSDRSCLKLDGMTAAPFHLWYLNAERLEAAGAKGSKARLADLIIEAVAGEIAGLLTLGRQGRAMIGVKPLREEDMAVLVRTNSEARLVHNALSSRGVPCVLHSMGNLFDTPEALEMQRLLSAVAQCRANDLIRAALTTDILAMTGEDLDVLDRVDEGWDEWNERFRGYNERWERYGFIEMFRHLISDAGIRERLLTFPDGERRLTNVLHLAEILHTQSAENSLGMTGLIKWLDRQMDPATLRLEEHELRLESDAKAVRIVTIHKSKGLEYPVVFCPFHWGGSKVKENAFTYHDPDADGQLNLHLDGKEAVQKNLAEKELLAENIRLLYVALTRAKSRCYLVWGPFKEAGTSALAYILHPPEMANGILPDAVAEMESRFAALSEADIRGDLDRIAERSGGAVAVYDAPEPQGAAYIPPEDMADHLSCRTFPGVKNRDRRIASFSYLLQDRTAPTALGPEEQEEKDAFLPDLPDHDENPIVNAALTTVEPAGIFAFPRGAAAGSMLHDVLEKVDFTDPSGEQTGRLVSEALIRYGFEPAWREAICPMVEHVVLTPLPGAFDGLTLSAVKKESRVSEMGFYFPLNRLTNEGLQVIFAESGLSDHRAFPHQMDRLAFQPVQGFMKGFMDLVFCHDGRFFLVDWKSNYLGPAPGDYGAAGLRAAMEEGFYILQYHLYLVALNRYLKMRDISYDYDKQFGGVYYIFLRGVERSNGGGTGIFYDRPAKETIDYLSRSLIEEKEVRGAGKKV
jgi:exodeoxyribonuclease V beta subunit